MEARNKENRRFSAVRKTTNRPQMVPQGLPAKGNAQSRFTLTAERVAFLVTGCHLMVSREVIQTAVGWLNRGWLFRPSVVVSTCAAAFQTACHFHSANEHQWSKQVTRGSLGDWKTRLVVESPGNNGPQ